MSNLIEKNNLRLCQQLLRTEVTCLLLVDNHVLSGMGGFIRVFDVHTSEMMMQMCVFNDSKLHGICRGPKKYFVVFGMRDVAVICTDFDSKVLNVVTTEHVGDWIQSVQWLEDDNIAIATAHNTVVLWNWKMKEKIVTTYCEEKCILYSSSFVGSSWEQLIVLAGTVYKEVIIWSPASSNCNSDSHCPVLHRLQGHQGIIFSSHYNSKTGRIHTTSDDRTVKGWQVNLSDPCDWQHAEIKLMYSLYGHTARVWKSIGLEKYTISIGEDSQICIWSLAGELLKRWSMHQGGGIWSITCSEQRGLLVTGGADGGISVLSLDYCMKNLNPVLPILFDAMCIEEKTEHTVPRRVILLQTGHIISVFQSGHVMHCCEGQNNEAIVSNKNIQEDTIMSQDECSANVSEKFEWTIVYFSSKLTSYCLLEVSPCRQRFALASLDGQILIFEEPATCQCSGNVVKMIDCAAVDGKIFSLQWLSSSSILTCESFGKLSIWSLEKLEDESYCLKKIRMLVLPYCKERWVTAALLFDNFLICGDRLGSIHLYSLSEEASENQEPCQTLTKVHGRLGVTFLMVHCNYIYSSGRDGTLQQYQILRENNALKQLCSTRMLFDWVASFCVYANDILVLGFSEKNFVVWTQQQQRLLFEVPCGGGHRSWDYVVKGNFINFVHIKHKNLFVAFCNLKLSLMPFLQTGFHPREVNCLLILHKFTKYPLLISGGEDTTIRVTLACSQNDFHALIVLHSHISSVRALAYCEVDGNKILMFSAGGRAQLKAWELSIEAQNDNVETVPKVLCQELTSHMLMDNSHKQPKSWKLLCPTVDPETRYMSLCVFLYNKVIFIAAGCSDGFFRLFHYCNDQQIFHLMGAFEFHHRCILNVVYVAPLKILTMATDGIVAFWDLSVLVQNFLSQTPLEDYKLKPLSHCKLHQSGIDSYDLLVLEADHVLLATGGDDSALVLTAFRLQHAPVCSVSQIMQWRMESAHVAQITGLAFVKQHLISTSVDRYVFVWKWFCDLSKKILFLRKVAEYCTTVADIHGLKSWPIENSFSLCLYGKGVEIIQANSIQEGEINTAS